MNVEVYESKPALGRAAAARAAATIRRAIEERGEAYVVAATGASQFEFLEALAAEPDVAWSEVTFFHLDEYVGLPESHPASFRRYLKERLVEKLKPGTFHYIDGEAADPHAECERLGALISRRPVDIAFVGIGENGHLAFNDPPADFETREPYIVVELDAACRRQQANEGWFATPDDVPERAISMSVRQVMAANEIVAVVPDERKAPAVRDSVEGEIGPTRPSSILREHANATLYLDRGSASLLAHPPAARGE